MRLQAFNDISSVLSKSRQYLVLCFALLLLLVVYAPLSWAQTSIPISIDATSTESSSSCNLQFAQSQIEKIATPQSHLQKSNTELEALVETQLLPKLQAQLPPCQNNVPWLMWAGQTLMQYKQYVLASDYLERALMLEPNHKGAKLDYALALAGSDQPDAALSLVLSLSAEPDMPEHLQSSINNLLTKLSALQSNARGALEASLNNSFAPQNKFYASIKAGRDSNLLGAPNLSELNLNFSGLAFNLPLDSSYLSQPGHYTRADVGWSMAQQTSNGLLWQTWAHARHRYSAVSADATQEHVSMGAELKSAMFFANAQGSGLQGGSGARYNTQTVGAGYQKSFGVNGLNASAKLGWVCELKVGPEWQNRNLSSNSVLSGRYTGLALQNLCQQGPDQVFLLAVSNGQDRNLDPNRAGGMQKETAARGMVKWGSVLLELEAEYKRDTGVYSLLLSENPRKIVRLGGRLEWQKSLGEYAVQTGIQWSQQRSNLVLFQQKNSGPYVGLIRQW
jgi:hypothetical protein